jgi:hypothetical protein
MLLVPVFLTWLKFLIHAGYQLDYVFDWTIMKYPQFRDKSKLQVTLVFIFPAIN